MRIAQPSKKAALKSISRVIALHWKKMDRVLTVDQEGGYTSPPRRSPFFCTPTTTSEVARE